MGSFMLEDQSDFSPAQTLFFLIAGIIWIPFALVLLYGFYESFHQKLYPQYIIIAFFFISAVCRCLWFFLRPFQTVDVIGVRVLSRIAMVAEFSGVSLLVLLWSRSLRATAFYKDSSSRQSTGTVKDGRSSVDSEASSTESRNDSIASVRGMLQRQKSSALLHSEAQKYLKQRRIVWLVLILCLWGVCIFNSLIWTSRMVYDSYSIFISMLSVATSFLITYIGYLNFLRVGDDLTMTEDEEASASATGEAGGGPPEEPTTFRLFYDFVMGRRSHKSKRCATQAQALRTVLRVSLVVSVLYMLQALGFLYKLAVVTMDMKSVECLKFGGSYYFIVLVVYVLPEFFPALVIMHSVSSPTSVFRRPILMTWENFLAIVHCKGKAGFTSDHSLCMLICTNFLSCCGACRGSKKRNLSSTSDGDEENGDGAEGARPALRRIESVSEDITPDFDDINKIEMAARKQSVSSSSRRLSDNPLHGDGKI